MAELPKVTVVEIEKGKPVIKKATPGVWTKEELEESARRINSHDNLLAVCEYIATNTPVAALGKGYNMLVIAIAKGKEHK